MSPWQRATTGVFNVNLTTFLGVICTEIFGNFRQLHPLVTLHFSHFQFHWLLPHLSSLPPYHTHTHKLTHTHHTHYTHTYIVRTAALPSTTTTTVYPLTTLACIIYIPPPPPPLCNITTTTTTVVLVYCWCFISTLLSFFPIRILWTTRREAFLPNSERTTTEKEREREG